MAQNEDSALGNEAFMTRVFQIAYEHVHHPLHALFSVLSLMNLWLNQQFIQQMVQALAGANPPHAEAPPGSHGTQLCPEGQPSCRPPGTARAACGEALPDSDTQMLVPTTMHAT